jgi:hypothetical protein
MTCKLPVLPLLWLLAAGWMLGPARAQDAAGRAESSPASQAKLLLKDAVRTLEGRDSISAKIRHEAEIFDKHLVGTGVYLEQRRGQDRLLRLELRTQLGDQSSSLVQVCDGRYFWVHRNLPSDVKLSRIDLAQVARAMRKTERAPGQVNRDMLPSLGGLPKLLRGLDTAFDFTQVEQGRWGKRKQPVWRLQGQWKREQLLKLLPNQKEAMEKGEPPDTNKLPEYLPDQVVLLLGREDLFPYRIEYRRILPEKASHSGGPTSRALVTMDLFEVNINVPIDPTRFIYSPGDIEFSDQTAAFLQSLGLK